VTVNSELQAKVDDLTRANNDIKNLLNSTDIATIFLNSELNITRFTPSATNIVNLLPSDVGRPFSDISTKLSESVMGDGPIIKQATTVMDTLVPVEKVLQTKDDHWFNMRIMPYRTTDNVIDGVVITFNDVTELKNLEQLMKGNKEYAEAIIETVIEPLLVLDDTMHVVSANKAFYNAFHTIPHDIEGLALFDINGGQWDIPELKKQLAEVLPMKKALENLKVEHEFPGIGHLQLLLNARKLDIAGKKGLILMAVKECPA